LGKGDYEECLREVGEAFQKCRDFEAQGLAQKLHQCDRKADCLCHTPGTHLLDFAHRKDMKNIKQFLESEFYLEP